jgi:hypothetical protein
MTYQEAAKIAMQCQDACNMGGVANSFQEAVQAVWQEAHRTGHGTDWVNKHPIITAFLDKMADLNGRLNVIETMQAMDACDKIAANEPVEV